MAYVSDWVVKTVTNTIMKESTHVILFTGWPNDKLLPHIMLTVTFI